MATWPSRSWRINQDPSGHRRRLHLVVEALDVPGQERRRLRQALEEVIDRRHLLVEAEGERDRRAQGAVPDRVSVVQGVREHQGRRDDASPEHHRHEGQRDAASELGRESPRRKGDLLCANVGHAATFVLETEQMRRLR